MLRKKTVLNGKGIFVYFNELIDHDIIDAIKDGTMAGAVQQDPVSIGAWCVEAAAMALQGEEVPPVIDTGFKWADASNIDDEDIVSVLYGN